MIKMKKLFLGLFVTALAASAFGADIKISQLPIGTASSTGSSDSFPFVSSSVNITKRMTIWDIVNIPSLVSIYAPKASPTFTGTVTAPTFVGALTGNASTATALAANPTDCSSNQFATAIAASGNLTCSQPTVSNLAALTVSKMVETTSGGVLTTSSYGPATNLNTASTGVARDASGNFTAGTITATLTGTASGNTTYTANNHGVVLSGSANAMTVIAPDSSTSKALVSGGASADPAWATLGIGGGGTGQVTKSAAFDALSPMSASGDIVYGGASGTGTRLPKGSDGQVLQLSSGIPAWGSITAANLTPLIKTGNYTLLSADSFLIGNTTGGGFTFTLPAASSNSGKLYYIAVKGSNGLTLTPNGADTIAGASTQVMYVDQAGVTLISDGVSNWYGQ